MFHSIRPLSRPVIGGHWLNNRIQFGLPAADTVSIRYLFYPNFMPQPGDTHALLSDVQLDLSFQSENVWGWEAEFYGPETTSLAYLIQLEKTDGSTHFIIDPYAKDSRGGERWGMPLGFAVDKHDHSLTIIKRQSGKKFNGLRRLPVIFPETQFSDNAPIRPPRPNHRKEHSIVYECHVRGMTRCPSCTFTDSSFSGTYRGLVDCIPYIKSLGVTAIELLPVFDFDENETLYSNSKQRQSLLNYWGYSPLLFFAPKQNYSADVQDSVQEFKSMVDEFHQAGLEIWLDVVFNHTAEFGADGPVDHLKSLAAEQWYLLENDGSYLNFSGCGNTLKCAHNVTRQLILECLYYWSNIIGVDGFRFDLATILNRDICGEIMDFPQLLWELRDDPRLKNIKLISEPWDASGGYELGKAASHADWSEWNDKYRDTLIRAVQGENNMMAELKESLLGSPGIFGSAEKGRKGSINFIASHDGMTMMDLVSYNTKHNEDNAEENQDGHHTDFSDNCGIEGETNNQHILNLRFRKLRMFHCLLLLSNGIPMLVGGDEFGRTQQGNNNAYCHDSPLTWLDWTLAKKNLKLLEFTKRMIALRKQLFTFLFSKKSNYQWFNASGGPEDHEPHVRTLHYEVTNNEFPEQTIRVLINCFDRPVKFEVPEEKNWLVIIDTDKEPSDYISPVDGCAWLEGYTVQVIKNDTIS